MMALRPGTPETCVSKEISITIIVFLLPLVKNSKLLITHWLMIMSIVEKND